MPNNLLKMSDDERVSMFKSAARDSIRVAVLGYPKSGNTWLTRMVAETLSCPAIGFWGRPKNRDISMHEGNWSSPYRVFKAHQTLSSIGKHLPDKIIYVMRDPRDVACSAAHYFSIARYREQVDPDADIYSAATDTISHGGVWPHSEQSWSDHVVSYETSKAFFVKYEDLVADAAGVLEKIAEHIGAVIRDGHINTVVEKYTFQKMKERGEQGKDRISGQFVRKGMPQGFKDELTAEQIAIIERANGETMQRHGYELFSV